MSVSFGVRENAARLFMHKIRKAMKSSENNPMDGIVHIDDFIVGDKDEDKPEQSYDSKKKKFIYAVQLTEEGQVKRFYALKIKDFSAH
jgi:hypothetical protein